ncbi:MAG TPA: histidine kinase [Jatrophihabitans sp.]|nr:histidine kinase [Jatrophihabitans sp.]
MGSRKAWSDGALAALVLGLSVGVLAAGGLGTRDPDARDLDVLGWLLASAAAVPLLARRRAPLLSYLLSAAATIALVGARYPIDFPFGPAVALYTVATSYAGDPRPARRNAAILGGAAFIPLAVAAHVIGGSELSGLAPGLIFWALTLGGVWIAGDRARLRRERMAELEERAARTEREAEAERRLAAAQERTRIARELHDSAGHAINVILVQAGAARLLHERDAAGSLRAIATVEDVARSTITEIDRLVHALRDDDDPPIPADPGAFDQLIQQHRRNGLELHARTDGVPRNVSRSVTWAAYRILQEALTNAARHGTGSADVALSFTASGVEVTVTNPTEPATASPRNGGHGIVGMRERASLLGGTLEAGAQDGRFHVHAQLPYQPAR